MLPLFSNHYWLIFEGVVLVLFLLFGFNFVWPKMVSAADTVFMFLGFIGATLQLLIAYRWVTSINRRF